MKKKNLFVASIGDNGTILHFFNHSTMITRHFSPSPEHEETTRFTSLLKQRQSTTIIILLDNKAQHYHNFTIPGASKGIAKKLAMYKLSKEKENENNISSLLSIDRNVDNTKKWDIVTVTNTLDENLKAWINFFASSGNIVKSINFLPIEIHKIALALYKYSTSKLKYPTSQYISLLISTKISGYIQIFLKNNHILFARNIGNIDDNSTLEITAGNLEQEVLNSVKYLRRFGVENKSDLHYYFILPSNLANLVKRSINLGSKYIISFNPHELREEINLPLYAVATDNYFDTMIASSLYMNGTIKNLYYQHTTQPYFHSLITKYTSYAMLSISALVLAISIHKYYYIPNNLQELLFLTKSIADIETKTNTLEKQFVINNKVISKEEFKEMNELTKIYDDLNQMLNKTDIFSLTNKLGVLTQKHNTILRVQYTNDNNNGQQKTVNDFTVLVDIKINTERLSGYKQLLKSYQVTKNNFSKIFNDYKTNYPNFNYIQSDISNNDQRNRNITYQIVISNNKKV